MGLFLNLDCIVGNVTFLFNSGILSKNALVPPGLKHWVFSITGLQIPPDPFRCRGAVTIILGINNRDNTNLNYFSGQAKTSSTTYLK